MNDELQEKLVKAFTDRFNDYNEKVLKELGKIIKKFDGLIPSDAYKLAQQLRYNTTINELEKELSKITGKSIEDIHKTLEQIAKDNIEFADAYYKAKGLDTPIYENSKELQKIVNSIARLSENNFKNIARSTGFKLLDGDGKPLLLSLEETYHKVIDDSVYAITTGKDSYQSQMKKIINQLADSGVRNIEYESGYSRRIDTSVRMNILDSMRQVSNECQRQFGKEFDSDGIEISVHVHPAPDHEDIQGHQFSNEEFDKFQNGQDCVDYKGNKIKHIHNRRERRKISEYNCYHYYFSIVLGVSNPIFSDEELQEIIDTNNKGVEIDGTEYTIYEATQLQRRLETEIRKAKELQMTARESGNNDLVLSSRQRITKLKNKYKEISNQAKLEMDNDRLYVPNYRNKRSSS